MPTLFDARQSVYRGILQELFPYVAGQTLDVLLASINSDLTVPLKVDATNSPSRVINVGPTIVPTPGSNRNKSVAFTNNVIPSLVSGTVTFPASNGGNITTSTGQSALLMIPVSNFVKVLICIDDLNNIQVVVGSAAASSGAAVVPFPLTNYLPFAYVILHNTGGTVDNVTQSNIFQIVGGTPPFTAAATPFVGWIAKETPLSISTTTFSVTFTTPQADTSYVIFATMENLVDPTPIYQQIEVTNKTVNGFIAQWDTPLDSSNYIISYIMPPRSFVEAESALTISSTSTTATLPIPQSGSTYPVIAQIQNLVDIAPQFETLVTTAKTTTTTSFTWNAPLGTGNYKVAYMINATLQKSTSTGNTSTTVTLPIDYGAPGYAIVATWQNTTDSNPKFQPVVITAKTSSTATFSWNAPLDTNNYILTCYAIAKTT